LRRRWLLLLSAAFRRYAALTRLFLHRSSS
jgi:hypothetical protein